MRYKKIKDLVEKVIKPSIKFIKNSKKSKRMPFKEIRLMLNIFYPKTKEENQKKQKRYGKYKHVFIIHSGKTRLALKIGRRVKYTQKDYTTYTRLVKNLGKKKTNQYFAKIYWRDGLFMLQKYGKKVKVPKNEKEKLDDIGEKYGLKDVREANIMKFGKQFKIVDAERK